MYFTIQRTKGAADNLYMSLFEAIPLALRAMPALGICLAMVGVLVFVVRHPVNGDEQVLEIATANVLPIAVVLAVASFLLLPSWVMLALALAIAGAGYAGQTHVTKLVAAVISDDD